MPAPELLRELKTTPQGLTGDEAQQRFGRYRPNLLKPRKRSNGPTLFISQFKSPIILILLFAAGLSFFLGDSEDTVIISTIIFASAVLGFWQERSAANAVENLLAIVRIKATVLRDGIPTEIPVEEIVPGDIVSLHAGASIPRDCLPWTDN